MTNRIRRKAAARIPLYFNQERSNGNPTGDMVCQRPRAGDDIDFSRFHDVLRKRLQRFLVTQEYGRKAKTSCNWGLLKKRLCRQSRFK